MLFTLNLAWHLRGFLLGRTPSLKCFHSAALSLPLWEGQENLNKQIIKERIFELLFYEVAILSCPWPVFVVCDFYARLGVLGWILIEALKWLVFIIFCFVSHLEQIPGEAAGFF